MHMDLTVLMAAVENGFKRIAKLVIQARANVNFNLLGMSQSQMWQEKRDAVITQCSAMNAQLHTSENKSRSEFNSEAIRKNFLQFYAKRLENISCSSMRTHHAFHTQTRVTRSPVQICVKEEEEH